MKKSLTISQKMWLGFLLLIAGYSVSLIFGWMGVRKTAADLFSVSEYYFPASNLAQVALSDFEEQNRNYILFISGFTDNSMYHYDLTDPKMDFLQKPFNAQQFLGKIREILDSQ
ncbi:MAG: hypothetical protein C4527_20840 [Candidatus Omnitrophota bacterium]|jgi:DNA-binding NtrC family response regulator|nr:MAG: hypothetical protein C4527_20840 [Candidatus Omnitrophota bacterium]